MSNLRSNIRRVRGWPDDGIDPGTKWEDVPDTWVCPDCGATKDDFDMIEVE